MRGGENTGMKLNNVHKWPFVLIGLILIMGLIVRLIGINHDLPFVYDPDEPTFVTNAGAILSSRSLNPDWFGHPGTTTIYSLAALYASLYAVGRITGMFQSAAEFQQAYHQDPTLLYLSGRFMIVAFSLGVILLVFLIARRLFNTAVAALAALFIAITPLFVNYSQLIRTDIQMIFWLLLAFWFCLSILEKGNWRDYILAGFLTGIAVVTKFPAAILIFIVLLAHLLRKNWQLKEQTKLLASGAACLLAMFISSPFLFLDYQKALSDLLFESRSVHLSHTGEGLFLDLIWYVQTPLAYSFTIIGLVLIGFGIVWLVLSKRPENILLLTFPILFWVFIATLTLRWDRWILPVIPFLCIVLAFSIYHIVDWVNKRWQPWLGYCAGALLLLLVVYPIFSATVQNGRELAGEHTRTQAANWMLENIPNGSQVLMEIYTPILPKNQYQFFYVKDGDLAEFIPDNSYKLLFKAGGRIGEIKDVDSILSQGTDYIVMSHMYDRFAAEGDNYSDIARTYEDVMNLGELIYEVNPTPGVNKGNQIRIYKITGD